MKKNTVYTIWILGGILFLISSILGWLLIDDYNILSQYISETYTVDTQYGKVLRLFGYIPSWILIAIFYFNALKYFPASRINKIGFYGLAIFYGLATTLVWFFPCDKGCNRDFIDPSISQIIHNIAGWLTYILVPISILLIGFWLKKSQKNIGLSTQAIVLWIISILFIFIFMTHPNSPYIGIYQRIIEIIFITWLTLCAFSIKNN